MIENCVFFNLYIYILPLKRKIDKTKSYWNIDSNCKFSLRTLKYYANCSDCNTVVILWFYMNHEVQRRDIINAASVR